MRFWHGLPFFQRKYQRAPEQDRSESSSSESSQERLEESLGYVSDDDYQRVVTPFVGANEKILQKPSQTDTRWFLENVFEVQDAVADAYKAPDFSNQKKDLPDKKKVLSIIQKTVQKTLRDEFDDLENQALLLPIPKPNPNAEMPIPKKNFKEKAFKNTFYPMALLLFLREILGGSAGIDEGFEYFFDKYHVHFQGSAIITFAVSAVFGIIAASILAVFDIKIIADELGIPYLSLRAEVSSMLDNATRLLALQKRIDAELNSLLVLPKPEETQKIQEYPKKIEQISKMIERTAVLQKHLEKKIDRYNAGFERVKNRRKWTHYGWVGFSAPYYAGIACMTVISIVDMCQTLPHAAALPPMFGIAFMLVYIAMEAYRFWLVENSSMVAAVDTAFGYPKEELKELETIKKATAEKQEALETRKQVLIQNQQTLLQKDSIATNPHRLYAANNPSFGLRNSAYQPCSSILSPT